ncbi:hypothetical protein R1A27_25690 [Methylobacterium sp. NMS12]|uniref:hypothetical protein n=1 Tax=Methylobacterium sp. NMS12 TaxID=3079766 RepID=UPI003F883EB3
MANEFSTVSALHKAAEITDREIDAAIDAVLVGLPHEAPALAEDEPLDPGGLPPPTFRMAETLKIHERAWKRNMVRTAILLAHPVKG